MRVTDSVGEYCDWIPAFAGMTDGACRGANPLCVSSLTPKTGGQGVDFRYGTH